MTKLTPEACRAARALLRWTMRDLSREANVALTTVHQFENGLRASIRRVTEEKMTNAFASKGVEIVNKNGTGARLLQKERQPG
ncbi:MULTISPECIES: helix-turn-helix transcriptional regulator [Euryhalocaulis]|uniref:helix-turn-helix transcriptional regulator n=1 Tax=Euryhalocaulis TaxID=1712422 RepID=UPI0003A51F92|nr:MULTISPECIES: helix-turn-helix transcriptional regulator [Euryhalocaulis]MBA4800875.1 helix-turn-helix transcriptional regulator [Euryhalocaulis sp.]